jgi:tRNA(adenine34) deaminase
VCPNQLDADGALDDDASMRLALAAAHEAGDRGDVPVGAVALRAGRVLATAGNAREQLGDPTAHAELLVLRAASAILGSWRLDGVTIVVTLEPCAMCAGALVNARVERLVVGAMDGKAGAAGSRYNLLADPRLNHEVLVTSGVLAQECASVLSAFFAERR